MLWPTAKTTNFGQRQAGWLAGIKKNKNARRKGSLLTGALCSTEVKGKPTLELLLCGRRLNWECKFRKTTSKMLNKYYRLGEWPHRGDYLVSLSIILKKPPKQNPSRTFLFFSKFYMQKDKLYQKAVSKGLHVWITPHWQHLNGFGLVAALRDQWKIRHVACQNFLFLASSLAKGITILDEQKWEPALLPGVLFPLHSSRQTRLMNDCACTKVAFSLSLQPRGEKRWKRFTLLHVSIHISYASTKMDSLSAGGSEQWTKWLANPGLQPYHTIGCRSCTLLRGGLQLPLSQPSPGGVFQSWWQKAFFSLEPMPRCSPRHDGKEFCASLLLAIFPQD